MGAQMTFKRYELKYMLTRAQKDALLRAMEGHMALDSFGHSTLRSIYLDTDTFRLIRRSIEKPVYKEKIRVRSYRQAGPDDEVFVELKKKFEKVVYKRRLVLPHRAAMDALESGLPLPAEGQIAREIAQFRAFYGETLKPAMLLSYEREAFYPTDGVDFRLTLDENILWRTENIDLGTEAYGQAILGPDDVLMELKTPGGIPLWMVKFLSDHCIRRRSFSKYGLAYQQLMKQNENGGLCHAC
ncbi:MAG: polyphosphate polymerase domain-containing protein [Clostridia bacterium]|nr:polyphosphate polymerase domain-containing protein [Clostridia bacterium]